MTSACLGELVVIFGVNVCFGPLAAPVRPSVVVCPPVVEWSASLQKRLAAELRASPADSAVRAAVALAVQQRDLNRRCVSAKRSAGK